MAKGCVYIPKTGKDAGKVFGSKESLAAHMNYTPALTDLMAKFQQSGGKADIDSVTKWLTDNGYLKEKPKGKPGRRERLAKLFEEPKVEVAPTEEAGVETTPEMTPEEVRINMKPITDEMAGIEMEFSNSGYSIDWDYDNEIIITDKNGEIVDAEELPEKLLPLAAQYEKATAGLAGYDFDSYQKALEQSRKDVGGIETEFEEVKPLAITEKATEEAPQPKPQTAQMELQMPERVIVEKNNENINSLIAKKSRYNSLPKTKKAIGANLLEKIKREAADMGFSVITTSGLNIKIVDAQTRKPISKRGVSRTSNKEYIQKKREAQSLAETGQLGLRASILNYFIGGKKIKSSQSELGEGSAEIKSAERKGLVSASAESIDGVAGDIISNIYGDIENAPEGMEDEVIAELQDVLATHEDRVSMEEELFDLYEKLIKDQEEAARYNTAEDADSAMDEGLLDEDSLVEYYETQSQINKLTEDEQEKLYRELYPEAFEQEAEGTSGMGDVEGTTREAQERKITYGPNEGLTRTDTAAGPFVSESGNAPYSERGGVRGQTVREGGVGNTVKAVWNKYKQIKFNGSVKVKYAEDVAHIMRKLEDKSVEHAFAVHVDKNGKAHIQFLGMGGPTSTVVDPRLVLAGVKKFKSKKVYLVHNHPSGSLVASRADVQLTNRIDNVLRPLDIELEHVIMDTYKKQYVHLFPDDISFVQSRDITKENIEEYNKALKVEIMDEQKILSEPVASIKSSMDVSQFLMQVRFTALPKHGMLLLNNKNEIIGNYIFKKGFDYNEATSFIAEAGVGTGIIFYSNQNQFESGIKPMVKSLESADVKVFDYVIVNSDSEGVKGYYESYADSGKLSETQAEYGTNSIPNELREPASRSNAEIQQLMEDSMDAVDNAIESGKDAQSAVNDLIGNKDWYFGLTAKQKTQFDEILQDEFGVVPTIEQKVEAKAAPTGVGEDIRSIVDNYYKLKDGDRSAKDAINEILDADPKLKYIYDNIRKINKQLQEAGVITDKTDGCP